MSENISSLTILCISPISIPNPNYGKKPQAGTPLSLKDCTSRFLLVPCGHCPQCIAVRQMYLVQRLQMESLNNYLFFCTLTYNNDTIPTLVTSTGYQIRYADVRDVQNMFKRLRVDNLLTRPFKYLFVSELGKKRGRPHFHIIFILPKYETDDEYTPINLESLLFKVVLFQWKRRVSKSKKYAEFVPLCTYQEIYKHGKRFSNYDLHYIKPLYSEDSFSNVAFYVLKYMLKPSDREVRLQQALHLNLPQDEYDSVWSLVRSRTVCSKGFGLNLSPSGDVDKDILSHIKKGISNSQEFPKFFNPSTGKSFPLSRYYRSRGEFYSLDDALVFYFASDTSDIDSPVVREPLDLDKVDRLVREYEKRVSDVSERGDFDSYSDCFH